MNIFDNEKILIFIIFVVPGFISLKFFEIMSPCIQRQTSNRIVDAITYSCFNYALLFWIINLIRDQNFVTQHQYLTFFLTVFLLLIAPILWSILYKWFRTWSCIQNILPHPTLKPWDYVFSKRLSFWVKIFLKDGVIIGGKYSSNSFASSFPAEEQLYLEETWVINDNNGLEKPKQMSAGVIILSQEISYIELLKYEE